MAFNTSGSIADMNCLDTLNKNERDIKLSPVAKNLSVIANFISLGIASRNWVDCFVIFGLSNFKSQSNFFSDMRVKFLKRISLSSRSSLIITLLRLL
ncbi:unnamed protein product [Acanthoscelides obtectus]|uniref:Uncharacterized protein n=1 Tax=Acanthoscelides obtectus TaxID=200917 RepID=A0A9P0KTU7_ACAOB|nr:unnamed protein product [Acanthoscelides obtectus]CAK1655941.1 hypothetical protein AOBTE_LOCUS19455 [Acanthoscelides obtectus]